MSGSESLIPFVKETEDTSQLDIIVDSREFSSAEKIVKGLEELGVAIRKQSLPKGDYVISDRCAIERKTVRDFVYTLTRRYLFDQIFGLKELYSNPIILIEGYLPVIFKYTKVNPSAIWGAMFAITKQGIGLIHTTNSRETIDFLYTAAKQEQIIEKRVPMVHPVKKVGTISDAQVFFIASLPNIGREKASALLQSYKTPLKALINVEDWAKNIHGLGPIITKRVSKILNTPFKQ